MIQTPIIQIDGPDHSLFVVGDEHLRMDKTGRVLIDLHAGLDQPPVLGFRKGVGHLFVRDPRQDQFHIDSALCRIF